MAALRLLGAQRKVSVCSKRTSPKARWAVVDSSRVFDIRLRHDIQVCHMMTHHILYLLHYFACSCVYHLYSLIQCFTYIYYNLMFGIFIFLLPLCQLVPPFCQGVRRVCDSPLFNALHSAELELIVCGEQDLDFAQLRKNAHYDGYQARMVTGCHMVPHGS